MFAAILRASSLVSSLGRLRDLVSLPFPIPSRVPGQPFRPPPSSYQAGNRKAQRGQCASQGSSSHLSITIDRFLRTSRFRPSIFSVVIQVLHSCTPTDPQLVHP